MLTGNTFICNIDGPTGAAGTLTCTLTLTIRKCISLVISILYFRNPFTIYHWLGSTLVFLGR